MHTRSSGKGHTQICNLDSVPTTGKQHRHCSLLPLWMPPPVPTRTQALEAIGLIPHLPSQDGIHWDRGTRGNTRVNPTSITEHSVSSPHHKDNALALPGPCLPDQVGALDMAPDSSVVGPRLQLRCFTPPPPPPTPYTALGAVFIGFGTFSGEFCEMCMHSTKMPAPQNGCWSAACCT